MPVQQTRLKLVGYPCGKLAPKGAPVGQRVPPPPVKTLTMQTRLSNCNKGREATEPPASADLAEQESMRSTPMGAAVPTSRKVMVGLRSASCCTLGCRALQAAHHGAKQSTSTSWSASLARRRRCWNSAGDCSAGGENIMHEPHVLGKKAKRPC